MSWDVVARANVRFPKGGIRNFNAAAPSFLKDAPKTFPKATGKPPKTVAKIIADVSALAAYHEMHAKNDVWTLRALLSEDAYVDFGPVLASAMSAAATAGGEGELLFYGFDTAPEGIAYRVRAKGAAVGFEKLSLSEEKKLASSREGKSFAAFVEACVKKERDLLMPASSAAFYKGMEGVKSLVAEALAFIQRADDEALVDIVRKEKLYSFHPPEYKTAKAIKGACRPDGRKHEFPEQAMQDVLRIVARLDRTKGASLARRVVESKVVPELFWDPCAEILCSSPDAPLFVKSFRRRAADVDGISSGKNQLVEWAQFLGGSKDVTTTLLTERLRHALTQSAKLEGEASDGAAQVATYLAAALLLNRKEWKLVPEIADACFAHSNARLRVALGELFAQFPPAVPVPSPRLDAIDRDGQFPQLPIELERRLAIDPKKAYEELRALLEANDYAAREAAFSVLRGMKKPALAAVEKKEPRWKPWRAKHPGAHSA